MEKTCLFFDKKTQMCILFSPLGCSYLKKNKNKTNAIRVIITKVTICEPSIFVSQIRLPSCSMQRQVFSITSKASVG